ncbi:MAG: 50S ribosomal protein L23 [Candidatus Nanohaloarchaea archaeon]
MNEDKAWDVLQHPHMTEKAMDKVDMQNKLVMIVDLDANKNQVSDAVEELFDVTVKKVNTSITPQAEKKAYIKLSDSDSAMDVATELGMM